MRPGAALLATIGLLLASGAARADNAFPDEFQVYFPAEHPQRIVLGTNFGSITSDDDGMTWALSCEAIIDIGSNVLFYQVARDGTVFAPYDTTVARSTDEGCTWSNNTGMAGAIAIPDLFVDPSKPTNVLAIAYLAGPAPSAIYQSSDEGASFQGPVYSDANGYLDSLEIARSTPGVAWAAGLIWDLPDGGGPLSYLLNTRDNGAHWAETDHGELGPYQLAIAAVDPTDADKVYLRVEGNPPQGDQLAIATDGGSEVAVALTLDDTMSSFAVLDGGTLVVGAKSGKMWIRGPADTTFTQQTAPHLRCLGEHEGYLYACGDDEMDGFALARSSDLGKTFQPVLAFSQVRQLSNCAPVMSACGKALDQIETLFPVADAGLAVDAGPPPATPDAGEPLVDGGGPSPVPPSSTSGCHCGSAGGSDALALLLASMAWSQRRRRSRPAPRGSGCLAAGGRGW